MKTQKQTINEMIAQIIAEARQLQLRRRGIQTGKIGGKPLGRVLSDGNLAFKYAKAWDKVSDLGG